MSGKIGITHDAVKLRIGPYDSRLAQSYTIKCGIFDTPSQFQIQFGVPAERVPGALAATRARTPVELVIDDHVQFAGYIDGHGADSAASGSSVTVTGRDRLSELYDRYITTERTFKNSTIVELVRAGMDEAYGQREGYTLSYSADVARAQLSGADNEKRPAGPAKLKKPEKFAIVGDQFFVGKDRFGANVAGLAGANTFSSLDIGIEVAVPLAVLTEAHSRKINSLEDAKALIKFIRDETKKAVAASAKPPDPTVTAKIGQRWFDGVIKPELDRAGLFLWHAGANNFILAAPNIAQPPRMKLSRHLNGRDTNVLSGSYRSNSVRRYTSCTVHAKSGSGAKSRTLMDGTAVDFEMLSHGYLRPFTMTDSACKTSEQAEALAHRKLAESRRQGWALEYIVPGHTDINVDGVRQVWAYDSTVRVIDEVLGVDATAYVESVEHTGSMSGKTTKIKLMRRDDALFGDGRGTPVGDE